MDALPERPLFWRHHGSQGDRALRKGRWKLVHPRKSGSPPALFDLSVDPAEQTDLAGRHPDVLAALLAELEAWEKELVEPLWGPGSPPGK